MNKGDLIFFKARKGNLLEQWIVFFSRSRHKLCHVAIYAGNDQLIEAQYGRKVGYANLSAYVQAGFSFEVCTHPLLSYPAYGDTVLKYATSCFNEDYDTLEDIKLLLRFFRIKVPYTEAGQKECATLARKSWAFAGILKDENDDTPESLYQDVVEC